MGCAGNTKCSGLPCSIGAGWGTLRSHGYASLTALRGSPLRLGNLQAPLHAKTDQHLTTQLHTLQVSQQKPRSLTFTVWSQATGSPHIFPIPLPHLSHHGIHTVSPAGRGAAKDPVSGADAGLGGGTVCKPPLPPALPSSGGCRWLRTHFCNLGFVAGNSVWRWSPTCRPVGWPSVLL